MNNLMVFKKGGFGLEKVVMVWPVLDLKYVVLVL